MRIIRIVSAILVCLAMTHSVDAQQRRQTKVRFNAPIEIPNPSTRTGVMTLPPGEYMFSLVDTGTSHHVIRVSDVSGKTVHSMVMTIPDYRLNATSKTVMYLGERPAGSPAAIKSWFYPGESLGERFVYPKARAQVLAAEAKQPVPSRAAEGPVTANETVQVQTPTKTEVAYDAKLFEPVDVRDSAGVEGEPVQVASAGAARTLPKTASSVYAMGAAGLLLLGLGFALRGSAYLTGRT
jgi:hypothetical protein